MKTFALKFWATICIRPFKFSVRTNHTIHGQAAKKYSSISLSKKDTKPQSHHQSHDFRDYCQRYTRKPALY